MSRDSAAQTRGQWRKVGHRGAPREFPANTMRSFARAVELGCDMVECDVRPATDGVLMLAHDPHVTDIEGRQYEIGQQTSATLQALDLGAGEGVPTLPQLVAWAQSRCAVMADMKCEGEALEAAVVAALAPLPPAHKIVPGAGATSRRRLRALDPTLPLALSLGPEAQGELAGTGFETLLKNLDTGAVSWHHTLLDATRIATLRAQGRGVYAWTVDDLAIMERLIAAGVDGIISNRADLLQAL